MGEHVPPQREQSTVARPNRAARTSYKAISSQDLKNEVYEHILLFVNDYAVVLPPQSSIVLVVPHRF
jgi:hypothetical protein